MYTQNLAGDIKVCSDIKKNNESVSHAIISSVLTLYSTHKHNTIPTYLRGISTQKDT
jgi:hypothetical protein